MADRFAARNPDVGSVTERPVRSEMSSENHLMPILRTLLERALKNVEQRFANQPDLRVEVQATLGKAFAAIGRYEEALELWQTVYEYQKQVHGPEHLSTLDAMDRFGQVGEVGGEYGGSDLDAVPHQAHIIQRNAQKIKVICGLAR